MSEVLNSLHTPETGRSWAQEVADAGGNDAPVAAPETPSEAPAPVQPEPQETAPEAPQAQETASEDTDRRVPLKALQEERQKRAEYERKLQDYERRFAELEQRMPRPPEPQAEPEPDPETDPIGALKHARDQLRRIQEQTAQQQQEARLSQIAYQAASTFREQAPDYPDAYRYAINSRAAELSALGTPQDAIPQILRVEEMSLIETAVRNGRNPAEAIYQFARARGFNPNPAPPPAPVVPPAPASVAPAAPDPALQKVKQSVAASAAAGGAAAAKNELTDKDISNLRGAAFDAAWEKLEQAAGMRPSMFRK